MRPDEPASPGHEDPATIPESHRLRDVDTPIVRVTRPVAETDESIIDSLGSHDLGKPSDLSTRVDATLVPPPTL
jgi:hypothetical protein